MANDRIQDAYRIVFNDILNNGCGMFVGQYDAKNGSDQFMHGICTVMEHLAYSVSDEDGYAFSDLFTKNMVESEKRVDKRPKEQYNNNRKRGNDYEN